MSTNANSLRSTSSGIRARSDVRDAESIAVQCNSGI